MKGRTIAKIVAGAAIAFYAVFHRLPKRNIPYDDTLLVSPANGRIVSISDWDGTFCQIDKGDDGRVEAWTQDVGSRGYIISIQLGLMDVHYQRAPGSGTVISSQYTPGAFDNALSSDNALGIRFENEHNEILIATRGGRYKIVQIAGFVARRIVAYLMPGQCTNQGDVIGLITFGSQVTVILPHNVSISATEGQQVVDGETVLAQWI